MPCICEECAPVTCIAVEVLLSLPSAASKAGVMLRAYPGLGSSRAMVLLEVPETSEAVEAARAWLRDVSFEVGSLELALAQRGAVAVEVR